jgi:hypothetical protein
MQYQHQGLNQNPPKPDEKQYNYKKQPFPQLNPQNLSIISHSPQKNPIKMKKISRQTTQRRKNRKINKELTTNQQWLENKLLRTQQNCKKTFGFCSKPDQSKRKNFNNAIAALPSNMCTQPSNLTFHNLCTNQQLATRSRQLLGLNLSFCLAPRTFHGNIK